MITTTAPDLKTCPYCAEQIRNQATVCKHCRRKVITNNNQNLGFSKYKVHAIISACLAAIIVPALSYASPWWTLHQLRSGVQDHDAQKLDELVDFPSLREGLKSDITARLIRQAKRSEVRNRGFAQLGLFFGAAIVDQIVDSYVTPDGIDSLMRGATPTDNTNSRNQNIAPLQEKGIHHVTIVDSHYQGMNQFIASVRDRRYDPASAKLVLSRTGPFSWKLSRLQIAAIDSDSWPRSLSSSMGNLWR